MSQDDANVLGGVKCARDRNLPDKTSVRLENVGVYGHLRVLVRLPWQKTAKDLGILPIVNREITLPIRLAFLCHAKEDKAVVEEVGSRLLQDGFLLWYDEKDRLPGAEGLLPGDSWESKIEQAIEGSDYILAFLSPVSCAKTGYVQREFRLAMRERDRRPSGQRFVIPILTEPCDPPREFKDIHFLRLWEEKAYERLKASLAGTVDLE
jgi:hypothetical protein